MSTLHYAGEAGRNYHEGKRAIPGAALPWVARLRAAKVGRHVTRQDVVLEYGVGYGWNLAGLDCRRRIGHDVSVFLAEHVRALGIEWVDDLQGLPAAVADVVICHHTLEHLLDPAAAMREMVRLLKPGGRLLLFVPWEREGRYRRYQASEPNHHLYTWNAQTLGNFIVACGLELVSAETGRYGYDRRAALLACRWRVGDPGFRLIRGLLLLLRPLREVRAIAVKPDPRRAVDQPADEAGLGIGDRSVTRDGGRKPRGVLGVAL